MDLGRTFQQLLLRDVLTHLVPGFLLAVSLVVLPHDLGYLAARHDQLEEQFGAAWEAVLVLTASYLLGYLLHSVTRFFFDKLRRRGKPAGEDLRVHVLAANPALANLQGQLLVDACGMLLRHHDPEYYLERVDRRTNLRNMSISLVGLFVWLAGLLIAVRPNSWIAAVALLAAVLGIARNIATLERELDEIQLMGALVLSRSAGP